MYNIFKKEKHVIFSDDTIYTAVAVDDDTMGNVSYSIIGKNQIIFSGCLIFY